MKCTVVAPTTQCWQSQQQQQQQQQAYVYGVVQGKDSDAPQTPYFVCTGMEDKINLMRLLPHFSF